MRKKWIAAMIGVLVWSSTGAAQYPGQYGQPGYSGFGGGFGGYGGLSGMGGFGPFGGYGGSGGNFMPNIYNPQTQPLSPYLNMFRGNANPAANYYFGTRPGTVAGGGWGGGGAPNIAMGGNRGLFFPQLASGPDPLELPEADPASATALPPAGHPVFYGNTMGYFPGSFGRGGMRPGMMGAGNMNRPNTTAPRR